MPQGGEEYLQRLLVVLAADFDLALVREAGASILQRCRGMGGSGSQPLLGSCSPNAASHEIRMLWKSLTMIPFCLPQPYGWVGVGHLSVNVRLETLEVGLAFVAL